MKPVTLFSNTETMYKALRELLALHPEYNCFDDGNFRIVEIPPQQFPPVNAQSVFVVMEYHDIDVWAEAERWLVVASDGEHPDGYDTVQDALLAITELDKPQDFFSLLSHLYHLALFEAGLLATEVKGVPQIDLDIDDVTSNICIVDINDKHICIWDPEHTNEWSVYAVVPLYPPGYAKTLWHQLYAQARTKGYGITSHVGRDFAIVGHVSGWPSTWSADVYGLERAVSWLKQQGNARSSDERIERRSTRWEEEKIRTDVLPVRDW
jgi:hypothetical protein